jgi:hypothetical protein
MTLYYVGLEVKTVPDIRLIFQIRNNSCYLSNRRTKNAEYIMREKKLRYFLSMSFQPVPNLTQSRTV